MKTEDLDLPERIKEDYIDTGITDLNPPQEKAVNAGLLDGEDMIVASPTASGKTFIAELAMVEKAVKEDKTAVYVVPLKALASEKYEDFSDRYEDLNVKISVGDLDDAGEYLENADIVIVTSEKLDSMLRHNPSWIHNIGLVVIDEIHLLTSKNRGPTLEVTLTRLRDLLEFQLLGLSATISNSGELAEWLDAKLVESDYRPVELRHGIHQGNEIEYFSGDEEPEEGENDSEELSGWQTGNEVKENGSQEGEKYFVEDKHGGATPNLLEDTFQMDKQAIVFCSSRKGAEKSSDRAAKITKEKINREEKKKLEEYADRILNELGNPTSQCKRLAENVRKGAAFHHAGLLNQQRSLIEQAFRKGLIKSVSATPTLAAGLNMPAYRVIMRDLKRYTGQGMEWIPVLEYEQMCLPYDEEIILSDGSRRRIGEIVEEDKELEVLSYNENEEEIESNKVVDTFSNGRKNVYEILTETGSFKATGNHPVLIKDDDNDEWQEISDLEVGNKIKLGSENLKSSTPYFFELLPECYAVGNGKVLKEYKEKFDLKDEEIAERLDISSSTIYHYKNNKKAVPKHGILKAMRELEYSDIEIAERLGKIKSAYGNKIKIPEEVTEDFMWLLGLILTDGNLNKTNDSRHGSSYTSIRVFNTNEDIIDSAKEVFDSLGLECYEEEREEGKFRLEVGNTLLAQVINQEFEIPYGNKSQETKIPEIIFKMPKNLQTSFIEGVYDGDGSFLEMEEQYKRRIHFSTSSEEFAGDLRDLLAGFGVKSRKNSQFIEDIEMGEKKYEVNKDSYSIRIRDKNSINKLASLIEPVKDDITTKKYSNYHNSNKHREEHENYTEILEINERGEEKVYNLEVENNHNYITSSREILHNCGRAGRPKYDDRGEAISVAKNPGSVDEIRDRYILGEPERIQSKLNVEPVLRMHTLALVASNFCTSMEGLLEFYRKTFYAHQFGDMQKVAEKIRDVVESLRDYRFIKEDEMKATKIGKKVSDLYIDPDSAHYMLESLEKAEGTETRPISYLFMLSQTSEMAPRLRVKEDEWSDYQNALEDAELYLLDEVPNEWEAGYESFLESMKTAMMMQSWIQEMDEERIMQEFGTAPGGIRAKMQNADWLLYGSKELMRMRDIESQEVEKDIEKLRVRMKHGIKEELLDLVQYDQIGRVRARKLQDHGIETASQIREVSFEKLKKLIGKKTAKKLKKQVGEENIFDREDITDWYD